MHWTDVRQCVEYRADQEPVTKEGAAMSAPQDPTHPKTFEGDDAEGHGIRIPGVSPDVEQSDDDVEGHGRSFTSDDDDVEGHRISR